MPNTKGRKNRLPSGPDDPFRASLANADPREADALSLAEKMREARIRRRRRAIKIRYVLADFTILLLVLLCLPYVRNTEIYGILGFALVHVVAAWAWQRSGREPALPEAVMEASEPVPEAEAPALTELDAAIQKKLRHAAATLMQCYRLSGRAFYGSLAGAALSILFAAWGYDVPIGFAFVCVIAGVVALKTLEGHGDRAAEEAAASVARAGPEVAGAIVDFMRSSEPALHPPAITALERMLGGMRASDKSLLTVHQRRYLYSFLLPAPARAHPALAVAILKMVEQFGDQDARSPLYELLALPNPRTTEERALLQAAHSALQSLEQADTHLARRGTLLSPAPAPTEPAEALLRPAGSGSHAPDELLRSVPPDGEGD